ncbi:MAG: hypothetical protein OHK0039_04900 [Bacteroidia bacterium]
MNRYVLLYLSALCYGVFASSDASAQASPLRWGKINNAERELSVYGPDTTAAAVVLGDYGTWTLVNIDQGKMAFTRHVRIKILKPEGLKYARQDLDYDPWTHGARIASLRAQTINTRGRRTRRVPLALKYLPTDTVDDYTHRKTFFFRDVQVGSIIEYRYLLYTNDWESLQPWDFQSELPTIWSQVRLGDVFPLTYRVFAPGALVPAAARQRWQLRGLPAYRPEPWSSAHDCRPARLYFQVEHVADPPAELVDFPMAWGESETVKRRWGLLRDFLEQDTRMYEDPAQLEALAALARALTREALTTEEQVANIYRHVRDHMRWDGHRTIYVRRSPSEIYRSRRGHAGEINLLLLELLTQAGIDAHKAFVCTRGHGHSITTYPVHGQFDLVVVQVRIGDLVYYLDATDPLRSYDLPPPGAAGRPVLVLAPDTLRWDSLPPTDDRVRLMCRAVLDTAGRMSGDVTLAFEGYAALRLRRQIVRQGVAAVQDSLLAVMMPGAEVGQPRWDHVSMPEMALIFRYQCVQQLSVDTAAGLLFPLAALPGVPVLPSGDRACDLDLGARLQCTYQVSLQLPGTLAVKTLPVSKRLVIEGEALEARYHVEADPHLLHWQLGWSADRAVFAADACAPIRLLTAQWQTLCRQPVGLQRFTR